MTWSADDALEKTSDAFRLLLDERNGEFTRSLGWYRQHDPGVPNGVWSLLYERGFIRSNEVGGPSWRLTVEGWVEACRLLRQEIGLDERFRLLSSHLKALTEGRKDTNTLTTVQKVAAEKRLSELWVQDAISGRMAEIIYGQYGAKIGAQSGYIDIPARVGNKLYLR